MSAKSLALASLVVLEASARSLVAAAVNACGAAAAITKATTISSFHTPVVVVANENTVR